MKKIISLLLSFVMAVSLAACSNNRHTQIDVPVYTLPDLSYWQENMYRAMGNMSIGGASISGKVTADQAFQLIKSVDWGVEADIIPMYAHEDAAHSIGIYDQTNENWVNVKFYNDFELASFTDNNSDFESLYYLNNSDEIRQFFIDNNYYINLQKHTEIIGNISLIFSTDSIQSVNSVAQQSGKDGTVTTITAGGQLEYVNIYNVAPYFIDGQYRSNADVLYRYDDEQILYSILLFTDESYRPVKAFIREQKLINENDASFTIADIDYTIWMQRLDAPQYNNFRYWLGAGSSAHREDSMQWTTAIMNCIKNLSLGEMVDINTKDYPRNQTYRIVLEEGSSYYNENTLVFEFYDDCNYLIVCNHNSEGDTAVFVCENHTKAYRVNNPETVKQIFSMQGQYVPAEDYESLEKFVDDYLKKTSVAKLNSVSEMDEEIPADYTLQGEITKLTASQKANTEGKLKYSINFVAMYAGTLPNGNRQFVSYKIYMTVAQQGSSWQMEEMAISNY